MFTGHMTPPAPTRHVEIERKLDAPAGFVLPDLLGVAGVAGVCDPVEQSLDATYFDTEDLRLQKARVTLRRRTGGTDGGWHLKRPASGAARTEERHPLGRATRVVPPALRAGVEVHARGAAIVPVVRLRTTRTVRTLLGADDAVLAEVAVDAVHASVPSANGRWTTLTAWDEIEVELVGGTEKLLAKVVKAFVKAGAAVSDSPSKVARALAAAGRVAAPGAEPAAGVQPPAAGSAGAVVLEYLRDQVAHLQTHDPLVRVDADDAVHQMRVACRRLRSALTVYRPLLDREVTEPLREELAWLGEELGAARDAEVVRDHLRGLVEAEPAGLVEGPVVERIVRTMDERYRAAHDEALVTLDTPRYFALLDSLDALVATPPFVDGTAGAEGPAADVLLPLVRKTWKRTARLVDAAHATDDPAEHDLLLHDVRKAAKRARYAGESLVAAFGKDAKAYGKQMAAVQEVLGEHQDSVVIRGYLVELSAAAHAAGESTFTYGRLHALEQVRGYTTETDFDGVWAAAQDPAYRAWLG
jgi:CHAD domain-containing protein